MKKMNLLILLMLTSNLWSIPPKISQPLEGSEITTNKMLIFVYPTPTDVIEKRWLGVELMVKDTTNVILSNIFPPVSNYRVTLSLGNITNGEYMIKTFYSDKKGTKISGDSIRNFTLKTIQK